MPQVHRVQRELVVEKGSGAPAATAAASSASSITSTSSRPEIASWKSESWDTGGDQLEKAWDNRKEAAWEEDFKIMSGASDKEKLQVLARRLKESFFENQRLERTAASAERIAATAWHRGYDRGV